MAPMLVLAVKLVLLVFILDRNLPSTCHAAGWLSPGPHGEGKTLENLVGWASAPINAGPVKMPRGWEHGQLE